MSNFASNIKIENFKSIRSLELIDCKRINLFIGKPNVGKSNILEALSLFSLPFFVRYAENSNLKDFIRIKEEAELFFDGDKSKELCIEIDNNAALYSAALNEIFVLFGILSFDIDINNDSLFLSNLNLRTKPQDAPAYEPLADQDRAINDALKNYPYKSYFFPKELSFDKNSLPFLLPTNGKNLFDVIQSDKELKQEFIEIFKTYGLNLVFDKGSQELKVMKGVEKGEIFLIPFTSIADSLQRLIFYKTAIKSNKNSIISFEEPEAHTYPPYIAQITQDIIEAETNQFFITTHSPYVVDELLADAKHELCIFLVDFKDGETVVKRLSDGELDEVYSNGVDLFFNNELYL